MIEIYAGDTFAYDVQGNQDKRQRETEAADKLFGTVAGGPGSGDSGAMGRV